MDKIYKISTANDVHDGDTIIARNYAQALKCACRNVGTALGGRRTSVHLVGVAHDASDYASARYDARRS